MGDVEISYLCENKKYTMWFFTFDFDVDFWSNKEYESDLLDKIDFSDKIIYPIVYVDMKWNRVGSLIRKYYGLFHCNLCGELYTVHENGNSYTFNEMGYCSGCLIEPIQKKLYKDLIDIITNFLEFKLDLENEDNE